MTTLNTQKIDKPFIDASYYTNIFKPNMNARIVGRFNNVDQHKADFDSFRQRASEFVDRLTNNRVTEAGGIDFIPVPASIFLRKAAATLVQHWYIGGYVMSNIDNALSIGSMNVRQMKNNETFRQLVPLDCITLIQKSGMWPGRVLPIVVEQECEEAGIDVSTLLTLSDALTIFQQAGKYDHNFHIEIDYSSELTGLETNRWIKIVETKEKKVSFNLISKDLNSHGYTTLFMDRDNFKSGYSEALMFSLQVDNEKHYYVETVEGVLTIYVKVKDNMKKEDAIFLLSNIYADELGEYKLLGSRTTSDGLTALNQENVLKPVSGGTTRVDDTKIKEALEKIKGDD